MRRRIASWVLLLLVLAGCATVPGQRGVIDIPIDRGDGVRVTAASDDETVLRAVAALVTTKFGLPLRAPIKAYVYTSREAFEHGLVADARVSSAMARDQAAFALGVGTAQGIYLRGDRLHALPVAMRAGVMAHELTHVSQYELAGGRRGYSEQWLREGFAEWVKYRAIEALGFRAYAPVRDEIARRVREEFRPGRFPDLATLIDNKEWIAARTASGSVATYGQAFVAVDRLIDRRGPDAAITYFRHAAASKDRDRNFADAFGTPRAQFLADFRRDLAAGS
jgi:hypothetical protein